MPPTPLLIIGAILLFLLILLFLPVRLTVSYRERVALHLGVLFLSFRLYPRRKKPKKQPRIAKKHKKAPKRAKKSQKAAAAAEPKPKPTLEENLQLVRTLSAAVLRKTGKHLRLRTARLHVSVATDDAAKTAVLYGAVSGAVALLLEGLSHVTRLRSAKESVLVRADYLSERSAADVRLVFSLNLYGALCIAVSAVATLHAHRKKSADKVADPPKNMGETPQNDTMTPNKS